MQRCGQEQLHGSAGFPGELQEAEATGHLTSPGARSSLGADCCVIGSFPSFCGLSCGYFPVNRMAWGM